MAIDSAVSREELEHLVAAYWHALTMHRRARRGSRARRRWSHEAERVARQFERALEVAVADEELRASWREHLHDRAAPEPAEPRAAPRVVFRGCSDTGSLVEIRVRPNGDMDVLVDGDEVERLDRADELFAAAPGLTFRVDGAEFAETFDASEAALAALQESVERGAPPPVDVVRELAADGLVDRSLGLTPRGRRALGGLGPAEALPSGVAAPVEIVVRGTVSHRTRRRLHAQLEELVQRAPRRVLFARGELIHEDDPALERPAIAKATLDMSGGRIVRAHVAAAQPMQAVHLLVDRLRRSLRDVAERSEADRRVRPAGEPQSDLSAVRPERRMLPPEERELVTRKTFALEWMTREEAEWEMRLLDHDFLLFTDAANGLENVVYRRADGTVGLDDRGPVLTTAEARDALDAAGAPFLFFTERGSGRGAVVYRRFDGHDGLITVVEP